MKQASEQASDEERDYDALPVDDFKAEIVASILANQVVVVIGETGSGKTTKIPQYCAEMGLAQTIKDENHKEREEEKETKKSELWKVAVTQPRRVAALASTSRLYDQPQLLKCASTF